MKMNKTQATRIVIVEDDPALRALLEEELSDAGYTVDVFADAESAWPQLQQKPVSLVISDLRLPRTTGIELMRRTRDLPKIPMRSSKALTIS